MGYVLLIILLIVSGIAAIWLLLYLLIALWVLLEQSYLLLSGKMTKDELAGKVAESKKKKVSKKKHRGAFDISLPEPLNKYLD